MNQRIRNIGKLSLLSAVVWMPSSLALRAHHSTSLVDMNTTRDLVGTIHKFQFTNPHIWIWIVVPTADGATEEWGVEAASPSMLASRGWKWNTLKEGDKVTISMHPHRSGLKAGQLVKVTFEDGRVIGSFSATPAELGEKAGSPTAK
ncbi:MAG: DUF6152 family protein [Steroidobacteraceae bacterium]